MRANVVISKSPAVTVVPPEPVAGTGDTINLTPYDKLFLRTAPAATVFLVFDLPIHDPAKTIKAALSRALLHYYPLSGRLATAGDGVVIKCTGEGVTFVAASANCTLKHVKAELTDPSLQAELAILYSMSPIEMYSQPLLLVQVTEFSCGGFVLGVTWDHAVADGVGLAQFLQAVGELARGAPSPSVVPIRTSDGLKLGAPPPFYQDFMQYMACSLQRCRLAFLDITVPSSLINLIKQDYSAKNHGRHCSAFDAVAAVLWRCRTRATMVCPEALSVVRARVRRQHARVRGGQGGVLRQLHDRPSGHGDEWRGGERRPAGAGGDDPACEEAGG
jgi:hypothetical protein